MAQLSSTQREEHSDITKGRERTDSPWDPAFCFQGPCRPPPDSHEGLSPPPQEPPPLQRGLAKNEGCFWFFGFFWGLGREEFLFCFVCVVLFCFQLEIKGYRDCTGLRKFSFSPSAGRGPRSPLPSQRECGPSGWLSKPNSGRD